MDKELVCKIQMLLMQSWIHEVNQILNIGLTVIATWWYVCFIRKFQTSIEHRTGPVLRGAHIGQLFGQKI